MARAIIINSTTKTVTDFELSQDDRLETLQKVVGGSIEFAHEFENGDVLYVNEEGLYGAQHFFDIKAHQPFAGNGVIVGRELGDDGKLADAQTTIAGVQAVLTFLSPSEALQLAEKLGVHGMPTD